MEQMITAVMSLTAIGSGLGIVLGVAARRFAVEGDSRVKEVEDMLPAANCGQCGFPGCAGAAEAIVAGTASPTCCPPGGKVVALAIAEHLGIALDADEVDDVPLIAVIEDTLCCNQCAEKCPTGAITMQPLPLTAGTWVMPKPALAA
jgi:electron transport complex protein RnfB